MMKEVGLGHLHVHPSPLKSQPHCLRACGSYLLSQAPPQVKLAVGLSAPSPSWDPASLSLGRQALCSPCRARGSLRELWQLRGSLRELWRLRGSSGVGGSGCWDLSSQGSMLEASLLWLLQFNSASELGEGRESG